MTHITIPTNSACLYEYVEPHIDKVETTNSEELYEKMKVFINGSWIGIAKDPYELYESMKEEKHKGIIVYISRTSYYSYYDYHLLH